MDMSEIAKKLGLSESKHVIRKAAELRRLADIQFDSSIIGVVGGNKIEWVSEKAYNRSFNSMQNGIGVKYKERFLASLPPSRRGSTDFSRPVFTALRVFVGYISDSYMKNLQLKVDKFKLIELAGTSESEFSSVSTSMMDLCFDVFGIAKEKKDPKKIKGNRELLDALPEKRRLEDGNYSSDDDDEPSAYKKRKQMDKEDHDEWKSAVLKSNKLTKTEALAKGTKLKQGTLDFLKGGFLKLQQKLHELTLHSGDKNTGFLSCHLIFA
ncbi:hypothetical protein DH2020_003350 [Rehmannia glutinosa]|uniref:ORC6 second cyclin-like domain-containing protein n=1 Tax=Rehmannia glutinosa TaxID=99300 RepID=A0ABR0XLJ0_REHGL